jgi:hypothetical protein
VGLLYSDVVAITRTPFLLVIPAQAGTQWAQSTVVAMRVEPLSEIATTERDSHWVPACAGMTSKKTPPEGGVFALSCPLTQAAFLLANCRNTYCRIPP